FGASAHRAWPIAYQAMDQVSKVRRSKRETAAASKGAPKPIMMAAMAISSPPWATEIFREWVRSLRVPATTMTPQPIMKLPASRAQRAAFICWRGRARSSSTTVLPQGLCANAQAGRFRASMVHLECFRIHDVRGCARNEVQQIVKCCAEQAFVVVLF